MLIVGKLIPGWPKLAWVALCRRNYEKVIVYHGPCVEIRDDWCVEGVWDGDFDAGGFDRTDLMFGTGLHARGDSIVFVTPSTTLDVFGIIILMNLGVFRTPYQPFLRPQNSN